MTDLPDAATNDVAVPPCDRIDTSRPHTARIWNYWLGGKDDHEVDRAAGDQIRQLHPGIGEYARGPAVPGPGRPSSGR
ncbi:hypothetical protein GCM10010121_003680 [Streptomyces brasiliensis]|uniref:SAM-dependent methyltransferase n=1 Tax=Streptomyces brasiliensis TaxID=1954 RepID=A0A917K0W3_9ACTN|nr:hypothetical protein GCM10010121_003680 [Streptomyces brasiliensis]